MEKFFDDERVNAVRGRAMRKTVWFAWLFTLIYTVAIVTVDSFIEGRFSRITVVDQRFVLSWILVQVITLIGGAVILLWGELRYLGARKDEMKAHGKALFYTKGFYAFVYIFAFAYCVHVAVNLFYEGYDYITLQSTDIPYGFFPSMLLECGGLFLIFSLKNERVMLNASEIEGGGKRYFKKVLMNILKFGGLCAVFTAFALSLFVIMSREPLAKSCLAIAIAGLATWLSLSFEYFLLSLMERLSERAQQKGRLSVTTPVSFLLAAAMSVCLSGICVYLNCFAEINSSGIVILYSYINLILERGILLTSAFFVMYFCSEADILKSTALHRRGKALNTLIISKLCVDVISMISKSIAGARSFDLEEQRLCGDILLFSDLAIDALYAIAILICIIPMLKALFEKKLLPRMPMAIPIGFAAVYAASKLLYAYFLRAPFNIMGVCLPSVMFVFFSIYVIKWFMTLRASVD